MHDPQMSRPIFILSFIYPFSQCFSDLTLRRMKAFSPIKSKPDAPWGVSSMPLLGMKIEHNSLAVFQFMM
jgi:hypothetical protein